MNELITTDKDVFDAWLVVNGYVETDTGALNIPMRTAQALFLSEDIQKHRQDIENSFIAIARSLWTVFKEGYWVELGFANFKEFLSSPGVDIAASTGYGLKDIGKFIESGVVEEKEALEIGASRMRTLLPILNKEIPDEEKAEWLSKASELTNLDLLDEISGKEIIRYSGRGLLKDLIAELQQREEFWTQEVNIHVRTV